MREIYTRICVALQVLQGKFNGPTDVAPRDAGPWESEDLTGCRSESALSLFDDDVIGYLLLTFHGREDQDYISTRLSHVVGREWWPLVGGVVADLVERNEA